MCVFFLFLLCAATSCAFRQQGTNYTSPIGPMELPQRLVIAVSIGVPLFSTVVDVFLSCVPLLPVRICQMETKPFRDN